MPFCGEYPQQFIYQDERTFNPGTPGSLTIIILGAGKLSVFQFQVSCGSKETTHCGQQPELLSQISQLDRHVPLVNCRPRITHFRPQVKFAISMCSCDVCAVDIKHTRSFNTRYVLYLLSQKALLTYISQQTQYTTVALIVIRESHGS